MVTKEGGLIARRIVRHARRDKTREAVWEESWVLVTMND